MSINLSFSSSVRSRDLCSLFLFFAREQNKQTDSRRRRSGRRRYDLIRSSCHSCLLLPKLTQAKSPRQPAMSVSAGLFLAASTSASSSARSWDIKNQRRPLMKAPLSLSCVLSSSSQVGATRIIMGPPTCIHEPSPLRSACWSLELSLAESRVESSRA